MSKQFEAIANTSEQNGSCVRVKTVGKKKREGTKKIVDEESAIWRHQTTTRKGATTQAWRTQQEEEEEEEEGERGDLGQGSCFRHRVKHRGVRHKSGVVVGREELLGGGVAGLLAMQ